MNSNIINNLIHTINPTANNSANYIKQLPYIEPPEVVLIEIESLIKELFVATDFANYNKANKLHKSIDTIIESTYRAALSKN